MQPRDVLDFWFSSEPRLWFTKDAGFDTAIRDRFGDALIEARSGRLDDWAQAIDGQLALIILLDQFSRNLYRGSSEAFAYDWKALELSYQLIGRDEFENLTTTEKMFGVMPMMHCETMEAQRDCLEHMEKIGAEGAVSAAKTHMDIIERFGRFPHRNEVLGRKTTPEEQAFLDEGGFSG